MYRHIRFTLIALALGCSTCLVHASAIVFSARLVSMSTDFQGEAIVWLGGLLTGTLEVTDSPYLLTSNPLTGEKAGRYAFTGQMQLDGTPITYRDSHVAVFDSEPAAIADSLGFSLYFDPYQVAPNLALVAMNMYVQLPEVTDLQNFGQAADLSALPNGSSDINLLLLPTKAAIFAYRSSDFKLSVATSGNVPEPSSIWLFAAALTCVSVTLGWRKRNVA